jgi:hypothetical protein
MKEGGSFSSSYGNDNYSKVQGSYNTGLMKNGFSASVLISSTTGDGYVDGTKFEGKNYYIALGYKPNAKHDFQFTFTGAPQWHNQRSSNITLATYLKYGVNGEPNTKYNSDWGTVGGEQFNMKRNFYHKPVASINWDWKINETTKLSTVVYGSWGRGGGSTAVGGIRGLNYLNDAFRTPNGSIDFDKIQDWNAGRPILINGVSQTRTTNGTSGQFQNSSSTGSTTNNTTGISRISSFNSHDWYGGIVNLNHKLTSTLTLDLGIDARMYKGIHYQNVNSLLGGQVYLDNTDVNNPNRVLTETYTVSPSYNPFANADVNEKIGYDNYSKVNWYGAFTQLEYAKDNLTAYVQAAVSQQSFKKVDAFTYLLTDPLANTSYKDIMGGNAKAGANYNINENHNVFVNAGYYSKQPFFNAVYPNNRSVVYDKLVNEKITGFEAGYGFQSSIFTAKVNLYYTTWKDRNLRIADFATTNVNGYFDYTGISETHTGVEFEGLAKVNDKLRVNAMFSVGNWYYNGQANNSNFNSQDVLLTTSTVYLDKVKVGDAAQTTASLGASYKVLSSLTVDANYNYNNKLYAAIAPQNFASPTNKGSLELPSYGLVDAGVSYRLFVGKNDVNTLNFRLNVNNLLNTTYIAESKTNIFADDVKTAATSTTPAVTYEQAGALYNGVATGNSVFFGFGRTWNFSLSYNF